MLLSCLYNRPELSLARAAQSDALRLDFVLQPGDIQLLSNFVMLHTRTQYEDYPVRSSDLGPSLLH